MLEKVTKKAKKATKQVTVVIDEDLHRRVKLRAVMEGVTIKDIVDLALRAFVEDESIAEALEKRRQSLSKSAASSGKSKVTVEDSVDNKVVEKVEEGVPIPVTPPEKKGVRKKSAAEVLEEVASQVYDESKSSVEKSVPTVDVSAKGFSWMESAAEVEKALDESIKQDDFDGGIANDPKVKEMLKEFGY